MGVEMNTEELIINKALNLIANNPFDYTDYDESLGLSLADAMTVIIMDDEPHDTKLNRDDVRFLMGAVENPHDY